MMRRLVPGIILLVALTLGGCFGETRLTEGAAAGAIVGGLAGAGTARYRYTDYAYPGGYARPSYGYGYYPPTPPPAYYGYYPY
jgi:hypothetical protein